VAGNAWICTGWWALRSTPIDAIPDLSDNQVIVFTDWSGHSPQEVEDQVTYPLTTNLQGGATLKTKESDGEREGAGDHYILWWSRHLRIS
jgi:Cu/Ag efflux pump CusA